MVDNVLKTPLVRSLNEYADQKIRDAIQLQGSALPCSVSDRAGSIVQVTFEVETSLTLPRVWVPVMSAEYIRVPVQVGTKGVVFPASVEIGGVTGLGNGPARLSTPANLAALCFFPVGNKNFEDVDPDTLVLYGEPGVIVRDKTGTVIITITPDGVTLEAPGVTAVLADGDFIVNDISALHHRHLVISVGAPTGEPLP